MNETTRLDELTELAAKLPRLSAHTSKRAQPATGDGVEVAALVLADLVDLGLAGHFNAALGKVHGGAGQRCWIETKDGWVLDVHSGQTNIAPVGEFYASTGADCQKKLGAEEFVVMVLKSMKGNAGALSSDDVFRRAGMST